MKTKYIFKIPVALLLIGCGSEQPSESNHMNDKNITKAEYGKDWPFTVDRGILKCVDGSVVFVANGKTYGVNGVSKSHGYADLEEIWAIDSSLTDANTTIRIGIGPILEAGVKLCK